MSNRLEIILNASINERSKQQIQNELTNLQKRIEKSVTGGSLISEQTVKKTKQELQQIRVAYTGLFDAIKNNNPSEINQKFFNSFSNLANKSAKESASVYKQAFSDIEAANKKSLEANERFFNSFSNLANKSAKESASAYKQAFKEIEIANKKADELNKKFFNATFENKLSNKSASQSGSMFESQNKELFKINNQKFEDWFAPSINSMSKSAKESFSVFEEVFKSGNVTKQMKDLNQEFIHGNKNVMSFGDQLALAGKKMVIWLGVGNLIFGTLRQLQEGVTFINELDKSMTNIAMITGRSRENIAQMTKEYANLASTLHDTTLSVMQAAEEFLRAGHNQEETLKLIQSSTVMSKIAGQDQKATAEQLIAITNAYGKNIKSTMDVVDKLTTVDNNSATSTRELGTAIERTAASAQMAGVTFERLVAMIGVVSSVTRKSASSIGESYKTIFSRFQDVKGGKNFDINNEDISNVERDLRKYADMEIRTDINTFKDFSVVLDELSKKWNVLGEAQKSAIAKSLAGKMCA